MSGTKWRGSRDMRWLKRDTGAKRCKSHMLCLGAEGEMKAKMFCETTIVDDHRELNIHTSIPFLERRHLLSEN